MTSNNLLEESEGFFSPCVMCNDSMFSPNSVFFLNRLTNERMDTMYLPGLADSVSLHPTPLEYRP